MAGAAVQVLQQLMGGSLNLAQAATDQALRAILRGAPIRIVAGAASNAPFRLVAAKTVKSWSDLKGKTISVGGLTDVTLYFLRVMARKNGLAPTRTTICSTAAARRTDLRNSHRERWPPPS